MKSSIVLIVLVFIALGLLLGFAEIYETQFVNEHPPMVQPEQDAEKAMQENSSTVEANSG
ncbi:MAG: hypothetical protein DA330_04010 [Nitrososphaera sp.]|nr:hypothetical protein [Nitrososphaera sp.]